MERNFATVLIRLLDTFWQIFKKNPNYFGNYAQILNTKYSGKKTYK